MLRKKCGNRLDLLNFKSNLRTEILWWIFIITILLVFKLIWKLSSAPFFQCMWLCWSYSSTVLQEGCKGLLYMVLHARVVLDLCEQLEQEISFEQVEGDFDSFQGKWLLEQLGNHHTLLKYFVESKLHKDSFLSEAFVEEVCWSHACPMFLFAGLYKCGYGSFCSILSADLRDNWSKIKCCLDF